MPRTAKNLWVDVVSFDNLVAAYYECRTGKRFSNAALDFSAGMEGRLFQIQGALINGAWRPSPPREFRILEPKPRFIQAPPFGDRVVHHAVVRQINPLFERRFIDASYACRTGYGVHRCVRRLQKQLRQAQARWGTVYALKADIAKYFASIDHVALMRVLGRTIGDRRLLELISLIIGGYGHEDGKGLPVGALTSQLFANAYLDHLDHVVKDEWGAPFYVRYMDDFVLLGPDKRTLWQHYENIAQLLATTLCLRLNRKTDVFPAAGGIDFCGYRTWNTHLRPRKRTVKRARRRFRAFGQAYAEGRFTFDDLRPSIASFVGYIQHCDGWETQCGVMGDIVLQRGRFSKGGTEC